MAKDSGTESQGLEVPATGTTFSGLLRCLPRDNDYKLVPTWVPSPPDRGWTPSTLGIAQVHCQELTTARGGQKKHRACCLHGRGSEEWGGEGKEVIIVQIQQAFAF